MNEELKTMLDEYFVTGNGFSLYVESSEMAETILLQNGFKRINLNNVKKKRKKAIIGMFKEGYRTYYNSQTKNKLAFIGYSVLRVTYINGKKAVLVYVM